MLAGSMFKQHQEAFIFYNGNKQTIYATFRGLIT